MEHNLANPFVPQASIIRYPNGIFEVRLHIHGTASSVEIVQHDNYVLITGRLVPRVRKDFQGLISNLIWSDQACGSFGRDIPLRLNPGTQIVILERRQDADDFVIRYTLRNRLNAVPACAQYAQLDAYSASARPYGIYGPYVPYAPYQTDTYGGYGGFAGVGPTPCAKGVDCTCNPTGGVHLNGGQGAWYNNQGIYHGHGGHGHSTGFNIGANFNAGVNTATGPQPVAQPIPTQEGLPL